MVLVIGMGHIMIAGYIKQILRQPSGVGLSLILFSSSLLVPSLFLMP